MTTTLRARFDGKVIIPEGPVDLPTGEPLVFTVRPEAGTDMEDRPLLRLAKELAEIPPNPDSPGDCSIQHDHYLYGTPKRDNP